MLLPNQLSRLACQYAMGFHPVVRSWVAQWSRCKAVNSLVRREGVFGQHSLAFFVCPVVIKPPRGAAPKGVAAATLPTLRRGVSLSWRSTEEAFASSINQSPTHAARWLFCVVEFRGVRRRHNHET